MQREIPFIIKAKDNLVDILKPYPILGYYYSIPIIWTIVHGSRPKLTLNDWSIAIKLLYYGGFSFKGT